MSEFKRENRYIVIKLNQMPRDTLNYLECSFRQRGIPQLEGAVVVESDWPEYEPVWQMIERRTTGQPAVSAAEELDAVLHWRGKHAAAIKERDALQTLLTAADERADVLEGLLRTSLVAMTRIYSAGRDFIVGAGSDCDSVELMMENDPTAREIRAALKPAESSGKPCACPGCDSPRRANSPFCVSHRSAKSRTRGQDPLTAEGLEWLMQNDGLQQ